MPPVTRRVPIARLSSASQTASNKQVDDHGFLSPLKPLGLLAMAWKRVCNVVVLMGCLLGLSSNLRTMKYVSNDDVELPIALLPPPSKPYFIIHAGPPKTGTTTLQQELTLLNETLAKDDYVYAGAYMREGRNIPWADGALAFSKIWRSFKCQKAIAEARLRSNSTGKYWESVPCWQEMEKEMRPYQGMNIIVSDETMSYETKELPDVGHAPIDWISVHRMFPEYEILVVLTYRRFFEWLPSAKQQEDRYTPYKPKMNRWPHQKKGKALHPLFPTMARRVPPHRHIAYVPTHRVHEWWSPHVNISVLNLHEPTGIVTNFLCHIIPNTPHACAASRLSQTESRYNPEQSLSYDMLTTAAAEAGWVNTSRFKRRQVVKAIQHYHEEVLNLTAQDFPLECPANESLRDFLALSLEIEANFLPDFFQSPYGEATHRSDFQKAVDRQKYCWIDAAAVLRNQTWQAFLRERFQH